MQEKAAELPEDGVPPEVLRIIEEEMGNDDAPMDSKLQPQKAATPCDAPELDIAAAGKTFAAQRPRTVVAEGQDQRDAQEAEKLALENLVADLKDDGIRAGLETYEVRAGNQLMDMFRPGYWAIAYCFLFKHATAGPDVVNTIKTEQAEMEPSRRKKGNERAPEVGIQAWAGSMQRQAAAQFRRDWNFSPTLWNYLFRTRINLEPNAYMFMKLDEDGGGRRTMTTPEIHAATQEVYRQLYLGTYLDTNNELKPVNGDLNKVSYVPGLSVGAHHVLNNLQARTRKVPGTHAVRSTMRHQTHANRICYGTPLFITFSPSEKDSALAIRMGRVRQSDPAIAGDDNKNMYSRGKPELDVEFCRLSPERLAEDFGFQGGSSLLFFAPLFCSGVCIFWFAKPLHPVPRGATGLRNQAGATGEGPAGMRLRLLCAGRFGFPAHLRPQVLPQVSGLRLLEQSLHGCIWQQHYREGRRLWSDRCGLCPPGMSTLRRVSPTWAILPGMLSPVQILEGVGRDGPRAAPGAPAEVFGLFSACEKDDL